MQPKPYGPISGTLWPNMTCPHQHPHGPLWSTHGVSLVFDQSQSRPSCSRIIIYTSDAVDSYGGLFKVLQNSWARSSPSWLTWLGLDEYYFKLLHLIPHSANPTWWPTKPSCLDRRASALQTIFQSIQLFYASPSASSLSCRNYIEINYINFVSLLHHFSISWVKFLARLETCNF